MDAEKNEVTRLSDWVKLMDQFRDFFYDDDNGIFTIYLQDHDLKFYRLYFDYILSLIKELKKFEYKYGDLYKDEKRALLNFKEKLLELNNGTNGIYNMYWKMSCMYESPEDY